MTVAYLLVVRSPRTDTVLGLVSLIVAAAALVLSWVAWQRPLPADPREVPSFGRGSPIGGVKQNTVVDAGESGRDLFEFLAQNEGRLVRIVAELDGVPVLLDHESPSTARGILVPGPDCPQDIAVPEDAEDVDTDACNWLHLDVAQQPDGSSGLFWDSGGWYLEGYFANTGYLDSAAGLDDYRIDGVSLVDAVT